ncbi:MAG TPA: hypothetical protein VFU02_14530 [Polyangiaceae bacterium]|nr:hypothetical protein [Polyangiaceae bacterium]
MKYPPRAPRLIIGLAATLFWPVFAACASNDAMDKRLQSLQEEVDRVQSRADRLEERLTALEVNKQKQTVHVDEEGGTSVEGRPALKVVKVGPESDAAQAKQSRPAATAADEDKDHGPRPVIRASGSGEGSIDNLEPPERAEPTRPKRDDEGKQSEGGS